MAIVPKLRSPPAGNLLSLKSLCCFKIGDQPFVVMVLVLECHPFSLVFSFSFSPVKLTLAIHKVLPLFAPLLLLFWCQIKELNRILEVFLHSILYILVDVPETE